MLSRLRRAQRAGRGESPVRTAPHGPPEQGHSPLMARQARDVRWRCEARSARRGEESGRQEMIARLIPGAWVRALLWLIARVWVGYQFLDASWQKLFGTEQAAFVGMQAGTDVKGFLTFAVSLRMTGRTHRSVLPPYAWLARNVFLPNAIPLGYLVAIGEGLVGVALIVGGQYGAACARRACLDYT